MASNGMTDLQRRVAAVLAAGVEVVPRPYLAAARAAGCAEDVFLRVARRLVAKGFLRRVAAQIEPRALRLRGAAFVAWRVPVGRLVRAGNKLAAEPTVTHCYARRPSVEWPYNLYAMAHGADEASVIAWAARAAIDIRALDFIVLPTRGNLKERARRYGAPDARRTPERPGRSAAFACKGARRAGKGEPR